MIIKLKRDAALADVHALTDALNDEGFSFETVHSDTYTVIHVLGDVATFDEKKLYAHDCVERVVSLHVPFVRTRKIPSKEKTVVDFPGFSIGRDPIIIAGPCSVESEAQIDAAARLVKASGAVMLRGGAYKPRTSPYSFQGLKEHGLAMLSHAAKAHGLACVSEILSKDDLPLFEEHVDMIQVGARNMQNIDLLHALGRARKPVLLKRGFGNTIEEWLLSAETIMSHGNDHVILCERGIRTFEPHTRATLDLTSVLAVRELSHLPVIVDPSHAAGTYAYIEGLTKASLAIGADGVMIEVHPDPVRAYSDGAQSLKPETFERLMQNITPYLEFRKKDA